MAMLTRLPKGRESLLMLEAQDIEPGSGLSNRIDRRGGDLPLSFDELTRVRVQNRWRQACFSVPFSIEFPL
jgi:hypothetical protein